MFQITQRATARRIMKAISAISLLAIGAQQVGAQASVDPANDFLSTFTGTKGGDLDVLSAQVFFDGSRFVFTATMNGIIGATPDAFYVWGLDKGAGTTPFAVIGHDGVRFDAVMIMRPATGMTVGATPVNDFFFFSGNTITGAVPLSFFPSTGFLPNNYKWNLWPRQTGPVGNAQISDFAPDNSDNALTLGVLPAALFVTPEPSTYLMTFAGLAVVGMATRRRRGFPN